MTIGTCPSCGTAYAAGSETCSVCGEPLSNVARVLTSPAAPLQPRWLNQNRQRAGDLRRAETSAADARMASLVEIDRRRLEEERAQAAQTAARERKVLILAAAVLGAVVLIGLLLLVATLPA